MEKLKVNGAWYLDSLPTMLVIELTDNIDNILVMANITPFRELAPSDLKLYKGYHPRKCKGQPIPAYLYRFYGMEKGAENASEVIHVRITPTEKEQLQTAANGADKPVSEYVRDWVRTL